MLMARSGEWRGPGRGAEPHLEARWPGGGERADLRARGPRPPGHRLWVDHPLGHPTPRPRGGQAVQGLGPLPAHRGVHRAGMHPVLRGVRRLVRSDAPGARSVQGGLPQPGESRSRTSTMSRPISTLPVFVVGDLRQNGDAYTERFFKRCRELGVDNHIVLELFTPAPASFFEQAARDLPAVFDSILPRLP